MISTNIERDIELLSRRISGHCDGSNVAANGKIDADFQQGSTGDCWLLASIKAIANNPKALAQLNKQISIDSKGNVTVELKGANKTYVITPEELNGSAELASGDLDVRAIEIAVNRYLHEEYEHSYDPRNRNDINDGGQGNEAFNILFGKGGRNFISRSVYGSAYDALFSVNSSLIEKVKKGNAIVVVSVASLLKFSNLKDGVGEDNESVSIYDNHVYSVINADDKYVYLVNPHDTSKVIKMTIEDFKDTFNGVDIFEME